MKTIILSAGQGKRLSPLTDNLPKCLLEVQPSVTILEWQMMQLDAAGVSEIVIVTGFEAQRVEDAIANFRKTYAPKCTIRTLYNPFYKVADNIGSVWLAKEEMDGPFMILNGDTLLTTQTVTRLLNQGDMPITLTIAQKDQYDSDDMKVSLDGAQLRRVGKTLAADIVHGESIGFMKFSGNGPALFRETVEKALHSQENLKRWYLSIIDDIAQSGDHVGTVIAPQSEWCEVDFPVDHKKACEKVQEWTESPVEAIV